jgi:hypothetical protein
MFTVSFIGDRATEDIGIRLMVVIALGAWLGSLAGLMTALRLRSQKRGAGLFGTICGAICALIFGIPALASPPADGVPALVILAHPGYLGAPFLWSVLLFAAGVWSLGQSRRARKGSSA